jgi:hypothetical protein
MKTMIVEDRAVYVLTKTESDRIHRVARDMYWLSKWGVEPATTAHGALIECLDMVLDSQDEDDYVDDFDKGLKASAEELVNEPS